MKDIRLYCIHYCNDKESFLSYLNIDLSDFNIIWDPVDPDYLIAAETIFSNTEHYRRFVKLYNPKRVTILLAKEAMSPEFNLFDYSVSFDRGLKFSDRHIQLPSPFSMFRGFVSEKTNRIQTTEEALQELRNKKGFCNFLYSNWNAHPIRDELFFALSSYKKVDSLGRHLNNVGKKGTGYHGHAGDCIGIKSPYKFSIACENASFKGYTSEKILTSLAAHTVPIYWGDPAIVDNINPEAFINCNDYNSIEEIIEVIRNIDSDDLLWARMVSAPWRTDEQIKYHNRRDSEYATFFRNIFSQDYNDVKRIGVGTFPHMIRKYLLSTKPSKRNLIKMFIEKLEAKKRDMMLAKKYMKG